MTAGGQLGTTDGRRMSIRGSKKITPIPKRPPGSPSATRYPLVDCRRAGCHTATYRLPRSSEGTVWHRDDLRVVIGRLEAGASASGPGDGAAATATFNPRAVYWSSVELRFGPKVRCQPPSAATVSRHASAQAASSTPTPDARLLVHAAQMSIDTSSILRSRTSGSGISACAAPSTA
jgi:hypothetical protein